MILDDSLTRSDRKRSLSQTFAPLHLLRRRSELNLAKLSRIVRPPCPQAGGVIAASLARPFALPASTLQVMARVVLSSLLVVVEHICTIIYFIPTFAVVPAALGVLLYRQRCIALGVSPFWDRDGLSPKLGERRDVYVKRMPILVRAALSQAQKHAREPAGPSLYAAFPHHCRRRRSCHRTASSRSNRRILSSLAPLR